MLRRGRSRRHSRPRMQTQGWQNNSKPRLERPRVASTWPRQRSCSQETGRSVQVKRKATRRLDADSMAGWQVYDLGVTVTDTMAESYLPATSSNAGAAAEGAADQKKLKYQPLAHTLTFIEMAFETLGPINSMGTNFVTLM